MQQRILKNINQLIFRIKYSENKSIDFTIPSRLNGTIIVGTKSGHNLKFLDCVLFKISDNPLPLFINNIRMNIANLHRLKDYL